MRVAGGAGERLRGLGACGPALPVPVVAAVSGVTLGRCSEFGGQLVDGAFLVVVLAVPPVTQTA
jgi:hypothetical protein